eukprot:2472485-Lingulodinium_polyedra.AAC.1
MLDAIGANRSPGNSGPLVSPDRSITRFSTRTADGVVNSCVLAITVDGPHAFVADAAVKGVLEA